MAVQKLPNPRRLSSRNWPGFFALLLLGVVFVSLVAIVQLQHQVRHLETLYAQALKHQVYLQEEQGKLKLEKHHLTALARVERIATKKLKMTLDKTPANRNAQTIYLEKTDAPTAE